MFKIENGIKMPSPRDGKLTNSCREILSKVAVGESFRVPDESHQVKVYQLAKKEFGYKMTSRRLEFNKEHRFWRVS